MTNTSQRLAEDLGADFVIEATQRGIRIRTPHLHPDGDVIDLYFQESPSGGTVTDLGETVRWLGMQTPETKRSEQQTEAIDGIARSLGVEFHRGMLQAKVRDHGEVAQAVKRVSEAAVCASRVIVTGR